MVTYNYDLDITPGGIPVVVHLKQYETDSTIKFNLKSRLAAISLGTITDCSVRGMKPDGNGYSVTATYSSNVVTVKTDAQMTAAAGKAPFELTLTESSGKLITATFWIDIQRAALDKDTIPSSSEIRELIDIIDKSDEIIAAAETIEEGNTAILHNLGKKVNTPTIGGTPAYGTAGQLLATNGDGTTSWTNTIATDTTLTISGAAADAKATGDAVTDLKSTINHPLALRYDKNNVIGQQNVNAFLGLYFEFADSETETNFWNGTHTHESITTGNRKLGLAYPTSTTKLWFYWFDDDYKFIAGDSAFDIEKDSGCIYQYGTIQVQEKTVILDGYTAKVRSIIDWSKTATGGVFNAYYEKDFLSEHKRHFLTLSYALEKIKECQTSYPLKINERDKSDSDLIGIRSSVLGLYFEFESDGNEAEFWNGTHTYGQTTASRNLACSLAMKDYWLRFYWANDDGNYIAGDMAFELNYLGINQHINHGIAYYNIPLVLDGYNVIVHAMIDFNKIVTRSDVAFSLAYDKNKIQDHKRWFNSYIKPNTKPLNVTSWAANNASYVFADHIIQGLYLQFADSDTETEFWSGSHVNNNDTMMRNIGLTLINTTGNLGFYWLKDNGRFADSAFTIAKDDSISTKGGLSYVKKDVTLDGYSVTVHALVEWESIEPFIGTSISTNTIYDKSNIEHFKVMFSFMSASEDGFSNINFGVDGDSITAGQQWSYYTALKLGYATRHNVGVGSAQWSDKLVEYNGQTYYPQIYGESGFLGMSDGWQPITDADEAQKRANNCGKNHLLKFIDEVNSGLYPAPDVFVFAFGTNDDPNRIGTVSDALASVNLPDVNDPLLRTTTGAMRWCIQTLKNTYPNCKILWSVPIQSSTDSRQNANLIKIPVMKEMAEALSVQIIDQWHNSGISSLFEKGNPYYLRDGTHPTVEGQKVMAECACSVLSTLRFID